jgi:3-oxoacyl-[acyl-carrier protein] reductase
MADRYQQLVNTPVGRLVSKQVGLPQPIRLERYEPGQPVISGPVLLGGGGRLEAPARRVLDAVGAELFAGIPGADETFKALVFDATDIGASDELRRLLEFFQPALRKLRPCGRVIVLGTPPGEAGSPGEAIAQRALEGFVRALGKELRAGATAQLVYVSPKAEEELSSTLSFFLSPKSAYVSGQVVRVGKAVASYDGADWEQPLTGKVALVTGAARGIGASIADVLARDGAHVVRLDIPGQGTELELDITDADAPAQIASHLLDKHGGVDVVVHNAGVTRDKKLAGMRPELWDTLMAINLIAPQRIDRELFARKAVRENGRIVCVSSISGIAGNAGQTNYSTSKAGVIGIVQAWSPQLAKQGVTVNAVAPGFIETQMTAGMPLALREAGRRMNSMAQGGLPIDVAETIAWFANPASAGVTGNIVRVCGQSMIGA